MPNFHVKGRLYPNGDSNEDPIEFQVQAESLDLFVEHLLCLGASIQSSGFENLRHAVAIVEQAGCTERTCKVVESKLDGRMWVHRHEFNCDCGQRNLFTSLSEPPKFCPNCGAKVVADA